MKEKHPGMFVSNQVLRHAELVKLDIPSAGTKNEMYHEQDGEDLCNTQCTLGR